MFQSNEQFRPKHESSSETYPAVPRLISALDEYQTYMHGNSVVTLSKEKLMPILEKLNTLAGGEYFIIVSHTTKDDPRLRYKIVVLDSAFKILRENN